MLSCGHHFSQAIEAAIELNLNKVEAGAQGEHKIQRGYLPVTTYSCHYLLDDDFRKAIGDFLVLETEQVRTVYMFHFYVQLFFVMCFILWSVTIYGYLHFLKDSFLK